MNARIPVTLLASAFAAFAQSPVPLFDSHGDLGAAPKVGSLAYDPAASAYRVTGGGANIWGAEDALYFVWKRVPGDVALAAAVAFEGQGVNAHRKAVLMIRKDLTPGSPYADIAVHGDGLTSLQYRLLPGGPTAEIKSAITAPTRIRIERRGNAFTALAAKANERPTSIGPQTVDLGSGPVYVGIGVCSHDATVLETAVFSSVQFEQHGAPPAQQTYRSHVTVFDLASRSPKTVYSGDGIIEAPNWSRDGKFLLVNTGGNLYRLPLGGGARAELEKIDLGAPYRANNDHDLSRDGRHLAFSASSPSSRQSQVYAANADGAGARLLTPASPSYFHGWSPDGKWLAFVGQRDGKYELYRVPFAGGPEERLTSKRAYDDGPEYSPDGKWIYFNSDRSGGWDIWRIPASGGGPGDAKAERITSDEHEDWFPHLSPDGKKMIVIAFPPGTKGHNDRMPGMTLRMMPVAGGKPDAKRIETLVTFYGGQGTINVNSWSPDSTRFAYVVYEPVAPPPVVGLWPAGAPGSEGKTAPESIRLVNGERIVSSIHKPSVTLYLPAKDKATGAAVVIAPGGGHRELWSDHEGHNIAKWLAGRGVAGLVLHYRLARETGSTYTIEGEAFADIRRAVRLAKQRAAEWNLNPGRIGVMGFSAGGEIAALAGTRYDAGDPNAADPVERQSSRPAFQALVYPAIPNEMPLSKDTPPAFLVCGENDRRNISQGLPELYLAFKKAGATAELHVYAGVGHGFGLRDRTRGPVAGWLARFNDWLGGLGLAQ
ncbi:MAG: alpha/beta hydrolase fold domain-containing protein [Bryobacteraceae bacterium]